MPTSTGSRTYLIITNDMDIEAYLKTIDEKTDVMWRCMAYRQKFERWDEDFIPLDDMSIDQLCNYYTSTEKIIKNK